MRRIWINGQINGLAALAVAVALTGCGTSKEKLLPHNDQTMLDIWTNETGGGARAGQSTRQLLDARQSLRRPLKEADVKAAPAPAAVISACVPRYCWALLRRSPLTQGMP